MDNFRLIALTPSGSADAALAIAASRAGEIGILNLDFTTPAQAEKAIARLVKFGRSSLGIRLDLHDHTLINALLPHIPLEISVILLAGIQQSADLTPFLATHRQLWVEVTSLHQAQLAQAGGAHALVAKGQEAGGWIGEETTFILLQGLHGNIELPLYAQGGIGLHTIAATALAGASGAVFDSQLLLLKESPLPQTVQQLIARMDGSETIQLGSGLARMVRLHTRPKATPVEQLLQLSLQFSADTTDQWLQAVNQRVGWGDFTQQAWVLGQDVAFAKPFADRFGTVSKLFKALHHQLSQNLQSAETLTPIAENNPLAQSHGTRYPIAQGPMTRVSDVVPFAQAVAQGGGLPFLALALLRAPEVDKLLLEAQQTLGSAPWGVGILGFVPLELRLEQLEVVKKYKPPFAIIAGGRPDQAHNLAKEGITSYLHVPSPGLLKMFIADGARHFILEGRECGGHIGPRSSFVLWESMIQTLLDNLPADPQNLHLLFAGGVHNPLSSAMVSALSAELVTKGVKVGVLMGTSYLFTREAVETGAILPLFQEKALQLQHTVTIESGPGHAIRCIENPFTHEYDQVKRDLFAQGLSADVVREKLDALNIGRLRIASKGTTRHPQYKVDPQAPRLLELSAEEQYQQGMYMIGQVAALRQDVTTIAQLHHAVTTAAQPLLQNRAITTIAPPQRPSPSRIAIIGIETILPKAHNKAQYWENILHSVYAISEIPADRWDTSLYFDADRKARDRIYSRWGGFIDDVPFDPMEFGLPPNALKAIDPMQLLALKVAKEALRDAGYENDFPRERTGVILGSSGGLGDIGSYYLARSLLPQIIGRELADEVAEKATWLPEWTEDSFAGLLPNVAAGRIANRFDLGGANYIVDAACGSSLAAVHLAVRELESESADMMIVGGVDTIQSPFGFMCFAKTQALSPNGMPKTFDENSDGIAISEGVVMLVLKRLADAEQDGDRIYAVIQGSAASSDGKALGLTAPRAEGQQLVLQRAYAKAGIDPRTVGLFEAHGTGTALGDRTEAQSLGRFLAEQGAPANRYPVGSVKTMIGHTKGSAGVAGLAKAALALYHKLLPPTINCQTPNPKANFGTGPLFVNSELRPWIHSADHPRRAGVSAFGFGGTNFHVVVEEYEGAYLEDTPAPRSSWPTELLVWSADSLADLDAQHNTLVQTLASGAAPRLADLAYTCWQQFRPEKRYRRVLVASSLEEVRTGKATTQETPATAPQIAFLFPGQGSQHLDMGRDLTIQFAQLREAIELFERTMAWERPLSTYLYPAPAFDQATRAEQERALTATEIAQPALGAFNLGLFHLLQALGVSPDMVAGHSYGEYVALYAANVFSAETLAILSAARGQAIAECAGQDHGLGTMAAVSADSATINPHLDGVENVWIANYNAPNQTILAGTEAGIANACQKLNAAGVRCQPINVAAGFHSPIVAPAQEQFGQVLAQTSFSTPTIPVYSNLSAEPHDDAHLADNLRQHLVHAVRWIDQIEGMYRAGARVFVECGPRTILTNLLKQILAGRDDVVTVAINRPKTNDLTQLQNALGQLLLAGVAVDLAPLYTGRGLRKHNLALLAKESQPTPPTPTTWWLNGGSIRKDKDRPNRPIPAQLSRPVASTPVKAAETVPAPSLAVPSPTPAIAPSASTSPWPRAVSPVVIPPSATSSLVASHHTIMATFLQTQKEVLMAALGRSAETPRAVENGLKIPAVPRSALLPVPAPLASTRTPTFGTLLLTDDGRGVASLLARKIERSGGVVVWNETDRPIDGVIHLAPLADEGAFEQHPFAKLTAQNRKNVGRLLPLAQKLASRTEGLFVAVLNTAQNPLHGGVRGFAKTVALELPHLRVQVIDSDSAQPAMVAEQIWQELCQQSAETVTLYRNGQRFVPRQTPLPLHPVGRLTLNHDDLLVITGGARGITADVALEIARRYRPKIALIGRSPFPAPESAQTVNLHDPKAIKNALIAQAQAQGEKVTLKEVEKRYQRLLQDREMRDNWGQLQATGATVRYYAADVRDGEALSATFAQIRRELGEVTGVIHGAGIIEDKLIAQKSAESFDRVFGTKADSVAHLVRLLNPQTLRFMALFSSAAGALGNRGQCDYAAANDLLNEVATYLDKRWPARVVALNWGPWGKKGMVSAELEAQFAELGIELIPVPNGVQALFDELAHGQKGNASVIYAGGAWGAAPRQPEEALSHVTA